MCLVRSHAAQLDIAYTDVANSTRKSKCAGPKLNVRVRSASGVTRTRVIDCADDGRWAAAISRNCGAALCPIRRRYASGNSSWSPVSCASRRQHVRPALGFRDMCETQQQDEDERDEERALRGQVFLQLDLNQLGHESTPAMFCSASRKCIKCGRRRSDTL